MRANHIPTPPCSEGMHPARGRHVRSFDFRLYEPSLRTTESERRYVAALRTTEKHPRGNRTVGYGHETGRA